MQREPRNNPYPGLRPFDQRDARLFFGRDDQVDGLLERLDRAHFIAVVGSSASGKSSLVRAGLLPALLGGHLPGAGSHWRVVVLRPGGAAIAALATALDDAGVLGSDEDPELRTGIARGILTSGDLSLIEIVREARLPADENVLFVVDQFEELFRFRHDRDDAPAFVKLMLMASRERRLYVLVTMRSDFLGDCSQFRDLPEAIGDGLFLVPRLTRDQLREAIGGPAAIAGGDVSPLLVTALLNDLTDSPDQLPVLQHALMRAWDSHQARGGVGDIESADFSATGGLTEALSLHGDDVYARLPPAMQTIAEKMFRALTDLSGDERGVRRPTTFASLCAVTGAPRTDMMSVVEAFRAADVSFLMPPAGVSLEDETVIDVSHESLMRVWASLRTWADDEARSARIYRRIADAADLYERGAGALLIDPALTVDLEWRDRNAPTAAWADRYVPDSFERSIEFLAASAEQRSRAAKAAARARRGRTVSSAGIAFALVIAMLAIAGIVAVQRARGDVLAEQSRALARDAQAAVDSGDAVTGSLIALAALPRELMQPDRPFTLEAYDALERATLARRELFDVATGGTVFAVSFSPDGKFFATASSDGAARIWDVTTRRLIRTLRGHRDEVDAADWSADGRFFVTASGDRTARIWNTKTFTTTAVLRGDTEGVITAQFSPDSRSVVTASWDGAARIWNAASGRQLRTLHADEKLWMATFSPNGRQVVTVADDGDVRIWDPSDGRQVRVIKHPDAGRWAAYSPDGKRLATAGADSTLDVWDVTTGNKLFGISGKSAIFDTVEFSPDGRRLVTASRDHTAQVRDAATGLVLFNLAGSDGRVFAAAFSPDGTKIVTGSGDRIARLWDAREFVPRFTFRASAAAIEARYSPDGRSIATAGDDGEARIWNTQGRRAILLRGHARSINDVRFSPDGSHVATASDDGTARIWNVKTGAPEFVFHSKAKRVVVGLSYSPDGKFLAISGGSPRQGEKGDIRIFDTTTGSRRVLPTDANNDLGQIAFSPSGREIAAVGSGNTIFFWTVTTRPIERRIILPDAAIYTIAYAPDGKRIVVGSEDGIARLIDVRDGHLISELRGHNDFVYLVDFSSDGRRIVTASFDKTFRIWDAASGAPLFQGSSTDFVTSVQLSPDGSDLLTGSSRGYVHVWPIPVLPKCQQLIDTANATAPRQLTSSQRSIENLETARPEPISALFMSGDPCAG